MVSRYATFSLRCREAVRQTMDGGLAETMFLRIMSSHQQAAFVMFERALEEAKPSEFRELAQRSLSKSSQPRYSLCKGTESRLATVDDN
jgi:uncharacterized protein (DUF305 family)